MFRHKEVADYAHWVINLTSLFWTCCSCAHLKILCLVLLWSPEILLTYLYKIWGFSGGASGKEPTCQCRRHKRCRFHPWAGKTPWRRAGQSTPALLPGASPRTEKPSGLPSIGLPRFRHDWSNSAQLSMQHASYGHVVIHIINSSCWT